MIEVEARSRYHQGGSQSWLEIGITVIAILLGGLFVAVALFRRLNFDEALALRTGWLLVHDIPAEPALFMPTTFLLGMLGSAFDDPGTVFGIARLAAALSVLAVFVWAARPASKRRSEIGLAVTILLLQGTFVVHGIEFRYDWALLIGWLVGYRLITSPGDHELALGVSSAWLATHHLKGVFLSVVLLLLATSSLMRRRDSRKNGLLRMGVGLSAGLAAWSLFAVLSGHLDELMSFYRRYFVLTESADFGLTLWQALGETLSRDALWWIFAAAVLIATVAKLIRSGAGGGSSTQLPTVVFAVVPLVYIPLHPRPWPYMLALPAPFLAVLVAQFLCREPRRARSVVAGVVITAGAIALFAGAGIPGQAYVRSLTAPRDHQVETLRLLRAQLREGDAILDPSGMAYFVRPCIEQWYLDSLFRLEAYRGEWMKDLSTIDPTACDWMLNTYRLRWLPPPVLERLTSHFVLIPGGGGLALPVGDPRIRAVQAAGLEKPEIQSFW